MASYELVTVQGTNLELLKDDIVVYVRNTTASNTRIIPTENKAWARRFTQFQLTENELFIEVERDDWSSRNPAIVLYNNLGLKVTPSDFQVKDDKNYILGLEGYTPITGVWRYKIYE